MGNTAKLFFAIVLLALAMKGVVTGTSSKLLWLQTITQLGSPLKYFFPFTFSGQPVSVKNINIHTLDTRLCQLDLFGSFKK